MRYISEESVCFISDPSFFYKERNYDKSNTVRILTPKERLDVEQLNPKKIVIKLKDTDEFFVRRLSDISFYKDFTIFSWRKDKQLESNQLRAEARSL